MLNMSNRCSKQQSIQATSLFTDSLKNCMVLWVLFFKNLVKYCLHQIRKNKWVWPSSWIFGKYVCICPSVLAKMQGLICWWECFVMPSVNWHTDSSPSLIETLMVHVSTRYEQSHWESKKDFLSEIRIFKGPKSKDTQRKHVLKNEKWALITKTHSKK